MKESKFYQEILQEGERAGRRADVLRVLRVRMKTEPPADLAAAVDSMEDLTRLETLLDLAATCADFAEFRRELPAARIPEVGPGAVPGSGAGERPSGPG